VDSRAVWLLAWALLGSTLPDVDLRRRHRMLAHNVFFAAAAAAAVWLLVSWASAAAALYAATGLMVGLASHLVADMLTVRGVALLYPLSRRRYRLARLRSSSRAANAALTMASVLLLAAYAACCGGLPAVCSPPGHGAVTP
jgi:inner membrane protein